MRVVFDLVDGVARTSATVLLVGESGTGKELLARAIAERSARPGGPFIAINCAAFPDTLLESELFGHARGAFTGASAVRRGLFEEADGGTLFLDEIGDISPAMQVRLLRVLQSGEVKPLGSNEVRQVDVRVIAATNRDLRAAARDGSFRSDLYYRLDVVRIRIPPLRVRREDIPLLVDHFLARYASRYGNCTTPVEPEAMQLLLEYAWPGNVRELENLIQRALVLARGRPLGVAAIRASLRVTCPVPIMPAAVMPPDAMPPAVVPTGGPADLPFLEARARSVADFSRTYVADALGRSDGNVARAARIAGMDKSNFRRLLKRCGIAPPRSRD